MSHDLRLHEIAESSHRILNPITLDKLMLVGEIVAPQSATRVLDIACGKGEMLAQWCAAFGCSGVGVDLSEVFLQAAQARVAELGVADRVALQRGDAADFTTDERFDVVSCFGASWFGGGLEGSLAFMQGWATDDATLVMGEPYWRREPPAGRADAFGQAFHSLAATFERFEAVGLEVVEMVLADEDSWDRYAAAHWQNLYEWIDTHPDDPDVDAVRAMLADDRRSYAEWQRECLGWGVFVLRRALAAPPG